MKCTNIIGLHCLPRSDEHIIVGCSGVFHPGEKQSDVSGLGRGLGRGKCRFAGVADGCGKVNHAFERGIGFDIFEY